MAKRNQLRQVDAGDKRSAPNGGLREVGKKPTAAESAADLDRLIHERLRLGIVSALAANVRLTFNDLKRLLNTSDGNLSVHARKLEEGGYIACTKSFEGRVPRTEFQITTAGRKALRRYLDHMEALIHAMRPRRPTIGSGGRGTGKESTD